jgi:penicillin G amidase
VVSTLLGRMLDRVDPSADPRLPGAVALLRGWDWLQTDENGDGRYDSPAVAVFNGWWEELVASVLLPKVGPAGDPAVNGNLVLRLLEGSRAALPLQGDYLGGRTVDQALTAALIAALDGQATRFASTDMARWLAPRAEIFWVPGGIGSVPNTLWMNRGTYGQLVHLGRGPALRAVNVIAPGQSGDYRSPHFADQLPLYATWQYKPMRLDRQDQLRHAESVERLRAP